MAILKVGDYVLVGVDGCEGIGQVEGLDFYGGVKASNYVDADARRVPPEACLVRLLDGSMPMAVGNQVVYAPKETITLKKSVVDRTKAKEARGKLKGFLDWAKTFNKLSDGWIRHDTREQFGTYELKWWRAEWDYGLPKATMLGYWSRSEVNAPLAYEFLQSCDDDGYMKVYLAMFDGNNAHDRKTAKVVQATDDKGNPTNHSITLQDLQYKWEYVQRKIYEIADKAVDIRKEVEVAVGTKAMTKVV